MANAPEELEAALDRALAPYKGVFPPAILAAMRAEMRTYATTHPYPVALVEQICPEPVVNETATRPTDAEAAPEQAAQPQRRLRRVGGDGR